MFLDSGFKVKADYEERKVDKHNIPFILITYWSICPRFVEYMICEIKSTGGKHDYIFVLVSYWCCNNLPKFSHLKAT